MKNPKIYFVDTGIRNYLVKDFREPSLRPDKGYLLEKFVVTEILKQEFSLKFWKTKSGSEIDFLIEHNSLYVPVEVKSGIQKKPEKPMHSFIKRYKPKECYLFHSGERFSLHVFESEIKFIHFYEIADVKFGKDFM